MSNKPFQILKGHGYLQKTMLLKMNQNKVQELLRGPPTPTTTRETNEPECKSQKIKIKNKNHIKRSSVYSVECGVTSVECKIWSVKWEM